MQTERSGGTTGSAKLNEERYCKERRFVHLGGLLKEAHRDCVS